jgi:type IV secretory pathway VirB2 component (pilin)
VNKKTVFLLLCALTVLTASVAFANTNNGNEFQSLYDKVIQWVTGLPAIIIAIGIAIVGIMRAFQNGGFIWALAGILIAALIFLLPTIIGGLGGATFGGAASVMTMIP